MKVEGRLEKLLVRFMAPGASSVLCVLFGRNAVTCWSTLQCICLSCRSVFLSLLSLIYLCATPPTLTPFELDLSVCSHSFSRRCYFWKVTLLLHYLYIRIYLCFIYNIRFFLNILFRYNTLYTYTSKNIVLIVGITFNVFHGPDEQWQVFECPVAVWSVISEGHLSSFPQGGYELLTTNT